MNTSPLNTRYKKALVGLKKLRDNGRTRLSQFDELGLPVRTKWNPLAVTTGLYLPLSTQEVRSWRASVLDLIGINFGSDSEYFRLFKAPGERHTQSYRLFAESVSLLETIIEQMEMEMEIDTQSASGEQIPSSNGHIPPDIQASLKKFQKEYPHPEKCAFIMMRFGNGDIYEDIIESIRQVLKKNGLEGLRADDKPYHSDLLPNVMTYMHGCGFGIAIYEILETPDYNHNVSFEVGYMMALGKKVLLLKDRNVEKLHSDLIGKLYDPFDCSVPTGTIPGRLENWLSGHGYI